MFASRFCRHFSGALFTRSFPAAACVSWLSLAATGCDDSFLAPPVAPDFESVYALNDGCFVLNAASPGGRDSRYLVAAEDGLSYAFRGTDPSTATRLRLKAADLGTYLLYDEGQRYIVSEVDQLTPDTE